MEGIAQGFSRLGEFSSGVKIGSFIVDLPRIGRFGGTGFHRQNREADGYWQNGRAGESLWVLSAFAGLRTAAIRDEEFQQQKCDRCCKRPFESF